MSTPGRLRIFFQVALLGGGCLAVGYGIMKAVTPTPEETYAALAPDLRRKVDANRAARIALEHAAKREHEFTNPDPDKPVWADPRR